MVNCDQRIVATSIEQDHTRLGFALHLPEHQGQWNTLEINVAFADQLRISRDQIILSVHLHPVTRVE